MRLLSILRFLQVILDVRCRTYGESRSSHGASSRRRHGGAREERQRAEDGLGAGSDKGERTGERAAPGMKWFFCWAVVRLCEEGTIML